MVPQSFVHEKITAKGFVSHWSESEQLQAGGTQEAKAVVASNAKLSFAKPPPRNTGIGNLSAGLLCLTVGVNLHFGLAPAATRELWT